MILHAEFLFQWMECKKRKKKKRVKTTYPEQSTLALRSHASVGKEQKMENILFYFLPESIPKKESWVKSRWHYTLALRLHDFV